MASFVHLLFQFVVMEPSAMRDFFKDNSPIKRTPRAPKNLCQLSQHAFSKTVQLWSLCRTVRGESTCTKGGVLSQKQRFLMAKLC